MSLPIILDLLRFQPLLRLRTHLGNPQIWCTIRQKYLLVQPEEIVRQLLVCYLVEELGYAANRIALEKEIVVLEQTRRFDGLVYDFHFKPLLLIECKAATVALSQSVLDQAALYNRALGAPYLLVTNGMEAHCLKLDLRAPELAKAPQFLPEIPAYRAITK